MAKPEWGRKYTCFKCGGRFYDMNKPEPVCPKCEANQTKAPQRTASSAKARKIAIPVEVEAEEPLPDDDTDIEGMGEISLDEISGEEAEEDEI